MICFGVTSKQQLPSEQLPNTQSTFIESGTVETQCNEPLYNEVLGMTNDFLYPNNSKIYGKEP